MLAAARNQFGHASPNSPPASVGSKQTFEKLRQTCHVGSALSWRCIYVNKSLLQGTFCLMVRVSVLSDLPPDASQEHVPTTEARLTQNPGACER